VLSNVDEHLGVSALAGMLLTGIAMLGVLDRAERTARRLDPIPLLIIAAYVAGLVLSYRGVG
jgi:hypothetical protein